MAFFQMYCFMLYLIFLPCVYGTTNQWQCGASFYDLPTIYIENQKFYDTCIPLITGDEKNDKDKKEKDSLEDWTSSCGIDTERLCIGVRYLKEYNTPLYSSVHMQNIPKLVNNFDPDAQRSPGWNWKAYIAGKLAHSILLPVFCVCCLFFLEHEFFQLHM